MHYSNFQVLEHTNLILPRINNIDSRSIEIVIVYKKSYFSNAMHITDAMSKTVTILREIFP